VWVERLREVLEAESTPPSPDAREPSTAQRVVVACVVGILAGTFASLTMLRRGATPDLLYPLTGARHFLQGVNPYEAMAGKVAAAPPYDEPLLYPFTTLLALLPLARLPVAAAGGLFMGISSGALAYLITRDGLWRVHLFLSAPFVVATALGQFAPLLMTMAFVPALGALATLKPNLGLALLGYRVRWSGVVGALSFVALSLVILPQWPAGWVANLARDSGVHRAPLLQGVGALLVLSLVRWRTRGGRLLFLLSAIPQGLFFSDQLLLWLLPHTRRQSIALTASSQLALMSWFLLRGRFGAPLTSTHVFVITMLYLPALVIVLMAPRAGVTPPSSEASPPPPAGVS
jgi:hypothetical protein